MLRSLKYCKWLIIICLSVMTFSSCSDDSNDDGPNPPSDAPVEQTLFVYMPWTGDSDDLTSYFRGNINSIKRAIEVRGLDSERVIVFMSSSGTEARMFEIVCDDGSCSEVELKEYASPALTTVEGISRILRDMTSFAPAIRYSMIVGAHGRGWINAADYAAATSMVSVKNNAPSLKTYLGGTCGRPLTRFFGDTCGMSLTRFFGGTSAAYHTDVMTFADALADANIHLEYLLFDVCYMSSVEVVYDLRYVADYIMGCPTEIMGYGMPYVTMTPHLLGEPNYEALAEEFYAFYSTYSYPYGTFSVVDCSQLDALAALMREINHNYTLDEAFLDDIQKLDGETQTLFYDLGDYVSHLCTDASLLERFNEQMQLTVPYYRHTDEYPYNRNNTLCTRKINAYSGLTTSAPSKHRFAQFVVNTNWHKDTN